MLKHVSFVQLSELHKIIHNDYQKDIFCNFASHTTPVNFASNHQHEMQIFVCNPKDSGNSISIQQQSYDPYEQTLLRQWEGKTGRNLRQNQVKSGMEDVEERQR